MLPSFCSFKALSYTLIAAVLFYDSDAASKCSGNINIRKEVRILSSSELNVMISAYTKMYNVGWMDWYGFIHNHYSKTIHNNAEFLPWHRQFCRDYEQTARSYEPTFSLAYWDATIDSTDPARSIVFTDNYFGGNGVGSMDCIGSGFARGWTTIFPTNHCFRRRFNSGGSISPFQSPESITSDFQLSRNYDDFRLRLEQGIHAQVHVGIGADMATMYASSDPMFFLHHSNIDRLWWKWQNMAPQNMNSYSGPNSSGSQASPNDLISGYNIPVGELFELGYGEMCFGYDDIPALNERDLVVGSNKKTEIRAMSGITDTKIQPGKKDVAKNTITALKVRADTQDNLDTSKSSIRDITSVPQMSLATAVDNSALNRFFPLIASNDLNRNSIALPEVVTVKATEFATEYIRNVTDLKTSSPQVEVPPSEQQPIKSNSIVDSLIQSTNKVTSESSTSFSSSSSSNSSSSNSSSSSSSTSSNSSTSSSNSFSSNGSTSEGQNRSIGPSFRLNNKMFEFSKTPKKLKLPTPARLPDSYLNMMGYDRTQYEKLYSEKVELVNVLNDSGYISPYI